MTTLDELAPPDQLADEQQQSHQLLTLADLMRKEDNLTMAPIIETLWPDGTLGFLGGPSTAGKSSYAMEEAVCLANGWPVFGRYAVSETKQVLFIEEEDDRAKVRERYQAVVRQHRADPATHLGAPLWFSVGTGFKTDSPGSMVWLRTLIADLKLDVVYLDALTTDVRPTES
jgi:RecA-family ATPase